MEDLNALVSADQIPNDPKVLAAIQADPTGQILSKVKEKHLATKANINGPFAGGSPKQALPQQAPAPQQTTAPTQKTLAEQIDTGPESRPAFADKTPAVDIGGLVARDEIPNNPEVIAAIKADSSGKILEKVKAKHALTKQSQIPPPSSQVGVPEVKFDASKYYNGEYSRVGKAGPFFDQKRWEEDKDVRASARAFIKSQIAQDEIHDDPSKMEALIDDQLKDPLKRGDLLGREKEKYKKEKAEIYQEFDRLNIPITPDLKADISKGIVGYGPVERIVEDNGKEKIVLTMNELFRKESAYLDPIGKWNYDFDNKWQNSDELLPNLSNPSLPPVPFRDLDYNSQKLYRDKAKVSPEYLKALVDIGKLPDDPALMKNILKGPNQPGGVPLQGALDYFEANRREAYLAGKALSGVTFGAVQPLVTPAGKMGIGKPPSPMPVYVPSKDLETAGKVFDFAGTMISGGVVGKVMAPLLEMSGLTGAGLRAGEKIRELKQVQTAMKAGTAMPFAEQGLEAVGKELFKQQIKKTAITAGAVGLESAVIGGAVGGSRGLIEGDPWKGVFAKAITESALFGAFGLGLLPVVGGAGKLFGKRMESRASQVLAKTAENPEVQALANRGLSPEFVENLRSKPVAELTRGEVLAKEALQKIEYTAPIVGLPNALLAHPELMREGLRGEAKKAAEELFNGPLKNLLSESPDLQRLIGMNKHLEALDSVQASLTENLTKNPEALDYLIAPFANNSKTLHELYANRLMKTVSDPDRYPNLKSNVLTYLNEPTAENALLIRKESPRRFFEKVQSKDFRDPRLKPQEVDTLVGDLFEEALGTIAGNGATFPVKSFGRLQTTDDILTSALSFNKELSRKFFTQHAQNPYNFEDYFVRAKPELAEGVQQSINLNRLKRERVMTLDTRREYTLAMEDLQKEMKVATETPVQEKLLGQMNVIKDQFKSLTQTLSQQAKGIREIETSLLGFGETQKKEIEEFVAGIFTPRRSGADFRNYLQEQSQLQGRFWDLKKQGKQLLSEGFKVTDNILTELDYLERKLKGTRGSIESSQNFQGKFGARENPNYLKADTEYADLMNAFMVAGADISEKTTKGLLSLPFLPNIENPRRRLNREFGPNSPVHTIISDMETAGVHIENAMKSSDEFIKGLGIKAKSVESKYLQMLGEERITQTSPEFLKLKPKQQERILDALPKVRDYYDGMMDVMNSKMRENNLPEIPKLSNYFLHFGETNESLPKAILAFAKGEGHDLIEWQKGRMYWKQDKILDPTRTHFGSEKMRKGGEYIDDAITGMQLYTKPALERIFYADLIRRVDTAKMFAPQNLGRFLDDMKEKYILRAPNFIDTQSTNSFKKLASVVTSRLGRGAILGNMNVAFQQLESLPMNFALSPMHSAKAMMSMFTKEGKEIASLSKNLTTRDPLYLEIDREASHFETQIAKKYGVEKIVNTGATAKEYYRKMAGLGIQIFDKVAARHAFLSGYYKGISKGLDKEAAAKFGDLWVEMIQANPTRVGRPEFYQSTFGKSIGQFSSFTTNYAASIMNDLPNIARTEGASKAVATVMKTVAGMMIANDVAGAVGIDDPFEWKKMVPFLGNFRFGTPGLAGLIYNVPMALGGNEQEQPKAVKNLVRTGAAMAMTGGSEIYDRFLKEKIFPPKESGKKGSKAAMREAMKKEAEPNTTLLQDIVGVRQEPKKRKESPKNPTPWEKLNTWEKYQKKREEVEKKIEQWF